MRPRPFPILKIPTLAFTFILGAASFFAPAAAFLQLLEGYGQFGRGHRIHPVYLPETANAFSRVGFSIGAAIFLILIAINGLKMFSDRIPFAPLALGALVGSGLALAVDRWEVAVVTAENATPIAHGLLRFLIGATGVIGMTSFILATLRTAIASRSSPASSKPIPPGGFDAQTLGEMHGSGLLTDEEYQRRLDAIAVAKMREMNNRLQAKRGTPQDPFFDLPGPRPIKLPAKKSPRYCPNCGYDLRATPDRCPECGTIPIKQ